MIRFFDIIIAFSAIVCLSPVFLAVSVLLLFTGEGQVLFKQKRVGYRGNVFSLFKFATMLKDSPNIGSGTVTLKTTQGFCRLGIIENNQNK